MANRRRPGVNGTMQRFGGWSVLLTALLVAGCSDPTGLFSSDEPPPLCPRVSVLADAASQVVYRPGAGRDLTDVDFEGKLTGLDSACEYEFEDDLPTRVVVQLGIQITASRGPANTNREAAFTYFVAVADPDRRIVQKSRFPVTAPFPGNRTLVVVNDIDPPVTLEIPLGNGRNGPDYEVFVGLQLTPEQAEHNRRQRSLRR